MKKLNFTKNNLITCALYLVIGVLLCAFRTGLLNVFMTIVGVLFIVCGILEILKNRNNVVEAAVEIVIGVVIIVLGWTIGTIVLMVFGILMAIKGAIDIFDNISKKKGTLDLINAIVTVVIGIILCVAPFAIGDIICIIVGVIFIIDGILALFGTTEQL